jgi:AcrR family transcriptional regulator
MGFEFGKKRPGAPVVRIPSREDWDSRIIDGMSPSPFSRGSNKSYHHGDLRQALLDATLALIEQNGPEGFTLRAAAREAGVTPSATYHHFKDKEDLVAAVAQEGFDLLRKKLKAAAQVPASPRERSRNVGAAYVLFAVEHPTRFRVMLGYGVLTRPNSAAAAVEAMQTYRFVREILVAGLTEDSSEHPSEAEVLGWWSVVHGLAFLAIDGYLGKASKSAKHADEIVRNVIDALDRRMPASSSVRRRETR